MRNRDVRLIHGPNGVYIHNPTCVCGKVSFDKKGAQTKRNALLKRGTEDDLRIYSCPKSNMWHLTKLVND